MSAISFMFLLVAFRCKITTQYW